MKQEDIEISILLQNNSPLQDFFDLSPNQMYNLLYGTFSDQSPVKLREYISDDTLSQIPFFNLTEHLLRIINRDNYIKLTATGALPRNILHELYDLKLIKEELFEFGISKLTKEIDSVVLTTLHINTLLTKTVRHEKGKMLLTNFGNKVLLKNSRRELFDCVFQTFTQKFNWGYNDGHPDSDSVQKCWPFTIYMLLKQEAEFKSVGYYAEKTLTAFPHIKQFINTDSDDEVISDFKSWYFTQTIYRFTDWFNLTSYKEQPRIISLRDPDIKKTKVLQEVFYLND